MLNKKLSKVALGGGCHWCTEAVFLSLNGVNCVEQGYVTSTSDHDSFSEAIIVHFDANEITLNTLIKIHLFTHKSTSNHSMREIYRSAVYVYDKEQETEAKVILETLQKEFDDQLITKVLPFKSFKMSREEIQNYYYQNPEKPFCKTFIAPKLKLLLEQFSDQVNARIAHK